MKIAKVRNVRTPERGTSKSAGIDFFVPEDFNATIAPGEDLLIPSGIIAKIPENYMLMAADKSGVVTSFGAMVKAGKLPKKNSFPSITIIGAKIVDEDYQGEIHIHLVNVGCAPVIIKPGMKIAQFILVPVLYDTIEEVPSKEDLFTEFSERGVGAFGSTN